MTPFPTIAGFSNNWLYSSPKVQEFWVFQNTLHSPHPIHLHTVSFWIQPLYSETESKLGDGVLGEVEKNSIISLPKGATVRYRSQNCVSPPGGSSEELYSIGVIKTVWSAPEHSSDWLVVSQVGVSILNLLLTASLGSVCCGQHIVNFSTGWRFQHLPNSSKTVLCVAPEGEPGPCPKAALLFLNCSSLVSTSPPFPELRLFEPASWTQRGPGGWMKPVSCKQETGRHRKALAHRSITGPYSVSLWPCKSFCSQSPRFRPLHQSWQRLWSVSWGWPWASWASWQARSSSSESGAWVLPPDVEGPCESWPERWEGRIRSGKMALQAGKARVQNWHPGYIHVFELLGKLEMGWRWDRVTTKILFFSAHRCWIKNTETEFGGIERRGFSRLKEEHRRT